MKIKNKEVEIKFNEIEILKSRLLESAVNSFCNSHDFNCTGINCGDCPFKYPDNVCAFIHLRLLSRFIYDAVNFGGNRND